MAFRRSMSIVKTETALYRKKPKAVAISDMSGESIEFNEDRYGSVLKGVCRGNRFKGTYHPPEMNRNIMATNNSIEPLPGLAIVEGLVELIGDSLSITGTWRHLDSILQNGEKESSGRFKMHPTHNRPGCEFTGWWQFDSSDECHDWQWIRSDTRNLPTRLVESVWMDRYGMLCAWLFLSLTSIQLISLACAWDMMLNVVLNRTFNIIYASCYTSSLVAFGIASTPKPWLYTIGVAFYAVGYFVFAGIYSSIRGQTTCYRIGSLLFLLGSVLLMLASIPVGPKRLHAYSPLRVQSAIWWGSTMFLCGSMFFLLDSFGLGKSWVNCILGLVCFTVGRCFFVRGSQTQRCTLFFCSTNRSRVHTARVNDVQANIYGAVGRQRPESLKALSVDTLSPADCNTSPSNADMESVVDLSEGPSPSSVGPSPSSVDTEGTFTIFPPSCVREGEA